MEDKMSDPTLTDEQFYDPAIRCLVADKAQGSGVCGALLPCQEHTLTNEELANCEQWAGVYARGFTGAEQRYAESVPRLIAALRASRAEVEELKTHIADEYRDYLGG